MTLQYHRFYVDNRAGREQRWMLTLEYKQPAGYTHRISWKEGSKREFDIFVWGEPLEITQAQVAVLKYWTACFHANLD